MMLSILGVLGLLGTLGDMGSKSTITSIASNATEQISSVAQQVGSSAQPIVNAATEQISSIAGKTGTGLLEAGAVIGALVVTVGLGLYALECLVLEDIIADEYVRFDQKFGLDKLVKSDLPEEIEDRIDAIVNQQVTLGTLTLIYSLR